MIPIQSKIFYLILVVATTAPQATQCMDLFGYIVHNTQGRYNADIKFLIKNKADLNAREIINNNSLLLHAALRHNDNMQHNNIIKSLVTHKANINATNAAGNTPLHTALEYNENGINNKIVKFLIEQKGTLNINHNNFSWIFFVQHPENLRLFLHYYESGINFFMKDSQDKTIKDYTEGELLKNILKLQRKKRTLEETKQVKTFLTINKIIAKKNKNLKIPKPILKQIFGYLKIPTYKASIPLF